MAEAGYIDGPIAELYEAQLQESRQRQATWLPDYGNAIDLESLAYRTPTQEIGFSQSLQLTNRMSIIPEFKHKSPGQGDINLEAQVSWMAVQYQQAGALGMSVLSQKAHFGGSLEDVRDAHNSARLPVLDKGFFSTAEQIYEAKIAGAAGILLIAAGLPPETLKRLYNEALALKIEPVVEVHNETEVNRVIKQLDPRIIGINTRNLAKPKKIDPRIVPKVAKRIPDPESRVIIAESGITTPEDVKRLRELGIIDAVLTSAGMKAKNPVTFIQSLRAA